MHEISGCLLCKGFAKGSKSYFLVGWVLCKFPVNLDTTGKGKNDVNKRNPLLSPPIDQLSFAQVCTSFDLYWVSQGDGSWAM